MSQQPANIKKNSDACPLAKKCGGCQLQNMSYDRQLRWKQARVEILLKKFCKVDKNENSLPLPQQGAGGVRQD